MATKKVLHIAIPKTGSSSIKKVFNTPYESHRTLGYFIENNHEFDYSFTFVRNTYAHLVSWYRFHHSMEINGFRKWVKNGFHVEWGDDWLASWEENDPLNQMNWIKDKKGDVVVDYIGRFEHLEEDYLYLCKQLEIENPTPLPRVNPPSNIQGHKNLNNLDYKQYYDDETKKMVDTKFKEEIEFFNFKF